MTNKRAGRAEIISIGDELLIGQVVNTNASWMAEILSASGIDLHKITTIGDDKEELHQAIDEALKQAQFVLLTGGLGPTPDDLTKPALCEYFNTELVFHEPTYKQVEALFKRRGFLLTDRNKQQAMLPKACTPIPNSNGTAAGMWFEKEGGIVVSMPGVPFEMKQMFEHEVLPRMKALYHEMFYARKTVMTSGVGESFLADKISDWESSLPTFMKLAYLPQPGIVRLRLSGRHAHQEILQQSLDNEIQKLITLIPEYIYGYDDQLLEKVVGDLLRKKNATLATAESCTGGYIAHLITSIAGSSAYFKGSVVAYENQVKTNLLGVSAHDLTHHGAVSREVVEQMAKGIKQKLNTDYALATSGIAGPDGGTDEKPVGTVWIALAGPDFVVSERFHFGEHRGRTIRRSALTALEMLRKPLIA
ncbi:MAG: competence/damage-inducible protein A [Bacteroidales bacterium]|jgi:nicotinamide-nucleotide amidase|nr:competence/damage-inducible protein A [Bacteroidales bacterium]